MTKRKGGRQIRDDETARALECLEELPPDRRGAGGWRVLEPRSYKGIAAPVRVSEAVIRKRVSRGLAALHAQLQKERTS